MPGNSLALQMPIARRIRIHSLADLRYRTAVLDLASIRVRFRIFEPVSEVLIERNSVIVISWMLENSLSLYCIPNQSQSVLYNLRCISDSRFGSDRNPD